MRNMSETLCHNLWLNSSRIPVSFWSYGCRFPRLTPGFRSITCLPVKSYSYHRLVTCERSECQMVLSRLSQRCLRYPPGSKGSIHSTTFQPAVGDSFYILVSSNDTTSNQTNSSPPSFKSNPHKK